MNDYANEHEQWEAIKTWWKENGLLIIIVMVLSLAGSFGWRYWQQYQLKQHEEASQLYDQLLSVSATDSGKVLLSRIASELQTDYPRTPYAAVSAMLEAKVAVDKNDLAGAAKKLQWVLEHGKDADLLAVTRIRLARILLAQHQPAAALELLNQDTDNGYSGLIEQVKGDIYLAQGQTAKARQAYQAALAKIPASEPIRNYVEMQLYRLPA